MSVSTAPPLPSAGGSAGALGGAEPPRPLGNSGLEARGGPSASRAPTFATGATFANVFQSALRTVSRLAAPTTRTVDPGLLPGLSQRVPRGEISRSSPRAGGPSEE